MKEEFTNEVKGEKQLQGILIYWIITELLTMVLSLATGSFSFSSIIRFILTIVIWNCMKNGKNWARVLTMVLCVIGAIVGGLSGIFMLFTFTPMPGIAESGFAGLLYFSEILLVINIIGNCCISYLLRETGQIRDYMYTQQ